MTTSKPVYLVKGDDPALVGAALSELRHAALGDTDPSFGLEELAGEELTPSAIAAACATPPFLVDRKVVVVRDVGRFDSDGLEPLLQYLAAPLDTTVLLLAAGGGQLSQKLANAVKKVGEVVDAATPKNAKGRTSWIVDRLHSSPLRFDAAAGRLLDEHLGEDLGRVDGIVATLVGAYGEGARIGVDELQPFLGQSGGVAPWDLTDAIDKGDTPGALDALHRMMGSGDRHALAIMATLHRHYAAMLRIDGSGVRSREEAASLLKSAPFTADKAMKQARILGFGGIRRAMALLAQADLDLKGERDLDVDGAPPGALVMELLVARLSKLGGRAPARR